MAETTFTGPHRRVHHMLNQLGIEHENEHPEFPPYLLDIYLTEWHLCIEVDGLAHTPARDAKRDAALLECGVPTLRLKASEVNLKANRISIIAEITAFIEEHADTTELRKAAWRYKSGV